MSRTAKMNEATRERLLRRLRADIDYETAGHVLDDVVAIVEEPDTTPHGLALCKVCRAPVRDREHQAAGA